VRKAEVEDKVQVELNLGLSLNLAVKR